MAVLAPGLISINIRALLPGYFSLLNTWVAVVQQPEVQGARRWLVITGLLKLHSELLTMSKKRYSPFLTSAVSILLVGGCLTAQALGPVQCRSTDLRC